MVSSGAVVTRIQESVARWHFLKVKKNSSHGPAGNFYGSSRGSSRVNKQFIDSGFKCATVTQLVIITGRPSVAAEESINSAWGY